MRLSSYSLVTLLLCAALPACTATCSVQKGSSSGPGSSHNDHDFSKPNSGSGGGSKPNGSKSNSGSKPNGSKPNTVADAHSESSTSPEPTNSDSTNEATEPEATPAKPDRSKSKPKRAKIKPKRAATPVPVPEPAPAPDSPDSEPIPLPEPVPVDPADPNGGEPGDGQGWVTPSDGINPDDGVDGGSSNVTPN